jgi:hypothetical protein
MVPPIPLNVYSSCHAGLSPIIGLVSLNDDTAKRLDVYAFCSCTNSSKVVFLPRKSSVLIYKSSSELIWFLFCLENETTMFMLEDFEVLSSSFFQSAGY